MTVLNSVVFLLFIFPAFSQKQTVSLFPLTAEVLENGNVNLTCGYSEHEIYKYVNWYDLSSSPFFEVARVYRKDCSTDFDDNLKNYNVSCGRNWTTLTLYNVTRKQHGDEWKCSLSRRYESNSAFLFVKIPITSVNISDPLQNILTVQEYENLSLVCETSPGRPTANISWFKTTKKNVVKRIHANITSKAVEDSLTITRGKITVSLERSDNQATIHCEGNNTSGETPVISSRKVRLNVQFIPENGPKIISRHNSSIYKVIEKRQWTLSCVTPGGNPSPILIWSCYNVGIELSSDDRVISNVTWTAVRGSDRRCTCHSSHDVAGNHSVYVDVEILFPPTTPLFMIDSKEVSGTIEIVLGDEVAIQCQSSGNPAPHIYWESASGLQVNTSTLNFDKIDTSDEGHYTCWANNTMESSSGEIITGETHSNIEIIILSSASQSQNEAAIIGGAMVGGMGVCVALAIVLFVGIRRYKICGPRHKKLPEVREEETPVQTYESLQQAPVYDNTAGQYETLNVGQFDGGVCEMAVQPNTTSAGEQSYIYMDRIHTKGDSNMYANADV